MTEKNNIYMYTYFFFIVVFKQGKSEGARAPVTTMSTIASALLFTNDGSMDTEGLDLELQTNMSINVSQCL